MELEGDLTLFIAFRMKMIINIS